MRRQLAAAFAAVAIVITLAFVVPLGLLVRSTAHDRALDRARATTSLLVPVVSVGRIEQIQSAVRDTASAKRHRISVYLGDQIIGEQVPASTKVTAAIERRASGVEVSERGEEVITAVVFANQSTAAIRVLVPRRELDEGVMRAWLVMLTLGALLVGLAVAIADRIAVRVVRPVERLAAAARTLGAGDLTTRVPAEGPAELRDTAHAFNTLAVEISASLRRERDTIAELAHRLRSPLTKLRLDVDRASGDGVDEVRADVDAVNEVLSTLIRDARASAEGLGRCDAVDVTRRRVSFWEQLADDEGRRIDVDIAEHPAPCAVGADELSAALDVLLDNVFSHTPVGTPLRVIVRTDDQQCAIVVADEGPGLGDAADTPEPTSWSTGLGLELARRFAHEASGNLEICSTDDGTTATLRLPLTGQRSM